MWNHFELKRIDNEDKTFCKYCLKSYTYNSYVGTSTMKRHYDSKHANNVNTLV